MTNLKEKTKKISIAHSPDADDAFMFYGLVEGKVNNSNYEIENVLKDIQTLNIEAKELKYDVQAISFHVYPEIEKDYQLLSCGGSVGYGYGPVIISKKKETFEEFLKNKNKLIAIPGEKTTAFLLLKLLIPEFNFKPVQFDRIIDEVQSGNFDYGLIIHEGQLSYEKMGLNKIADLGEWWLSETNLPVPLGGNVIKRNFDVDTKKEINNIIKNSISYGLKNKTAVVNEVRKFARGIENDVNLVDKFVGMYVNDFTLDYGIEGKLAIKKLYEMAFEKGIIKHIPKLDFVE